ncbi:hypothetical protein [Streptomyces sp. NPDC000880]
MHGPGYMPPQPPRDIPTSVIVLLRVLFAILPVLSCGMLSWGTMLRLALVTRRARDWVLFAVVLVSFMACFGTVLSDPTEGLTMPRSDVAIGIMLAVAVAVVPYFLYADIKHFSSRVAQPYYGPTVNYGLPPQAQPLPPTPPVAGYGYPAVSHQPQSQPQSQPQFPPHPQSPPAQPRIDQPRIDQVRAELDELSDYLRKEQGREQGR